MVTSPDQPVAPVGPVAQVLVDVPLAHLDRPFDYLVPAAMAEQAQPGVRVKVPFAGRDVSGFIVSRGETGDAARSLRPLRKVVSAEPVLTAEVADLIGDVARRWAGTRSDVVRLAVPARLARVEKETPPSPFHATVPPDPSCWRAYESGERYLKALVEGGSPRAVWSVMPTSDWTVPLAEALIATAAGGRGALACVADRRDLIRLDEALKARLGDDQYAVLTTTLGPTRRYRTFLAVERGQRRIVIGTRAAAFAPVANLGLVAIFDDGDDLFDEPRAPYCTTREVLLLRAQRSGCAVLISGYAQSVEARYLVRTGWAGELVADRERVRRHMSVQVIEPDSRVPSKVFTAMRAALREGPVLVQVARRGYAVRLACETCRAPVACERCHGPLRIGSRAAPPACGWCGVVASAWACPACGGRGLRAPRVGADRTVEELGRAFPGVVVRQSSGDTIVDRVSDKPAIVVATTGAEPIAEGGYTAVVLLDAEVLLAREELRASEEALRRWMNAATLARSTEEGGRVLIVGDAAVPSIQALVRWDPRGFVEREIEERTVAHLPPASMVAQVSGEASAVEAFVAELALPARADVLGPIRPVGADADPDSPVRVVIRVPRSERAQMTAALRVVQGVWSTRKRTHVRVHIDPRNLG